MAGSEDTQGIKIIPNITYADDWDEITKLDVTYEAFSERMDALILILVEKADFTKAKASSTLTGLFSKSENEEAFDKGIDLVFYATEEAAQWARGELSRLRGFEEQARLARDGRIELGKNETPVLHGNATSRVILSDLAITLLDIVEEPGKELVLLLAELLNVDRHRQANDESYNHEFDLAAQIVAQNPDIKQNDLAAMVGKDKGTISKWINHKKYKVKFENKVEMFRRVFSGEIRENMKRYKERMDRQAKGD